MSAPPGPLSLVPFVSVDDMMQLVSNTGVERFLLDLAGYIEDDFRRWPFFQKTPRVAAHAVDGSIELMPTSDGELYAFKYVNGHPKNAREGRQTVCAFGVLADVATGYPVLFTEMTILTALRTAATSAMAAKYLAPRGARVMAIIGNGAQCEFQALAFKALVGIDAVRLYDIDPAASRKAARNLVGAGLGVTICKTAEDAVLGAEIITTSTADRARARVLSSNMIGAGIHINAIGGDCPGKTELAPEIVARADVFVEYPEQTRVEGEIQQMPADFPVTELWRVIAGLAAGRRDARAITLFDSVGFAIEDFAALRYVRDRLGGRVEKLDLVADPDDPRDLYGMLLRAGVQAAA
jgi:ornithine cyclodeaminase